MSRVSIEDGEVSPMRKIFLRVITMAAALYIGICACLFVFQRNLIYYPQPRANTTGITVLTIEDGAERALVSSRPHEGEDAVIYFGGNAEDVSLDMPEYAAAFPNAAIYLLHYRGYGGSSGAPTEQGIVADALALFDLVHAQHKNVVVIGRSLGTGVAVQVASQRPVVRLVLVTPYDASLTSQQNIIRICRLDCSSATNLNPGATHRTSRPRP
jgi:uncharacterized protein